MRTVKDILSLMRISQWYKNVLIFIPLIFSLNFFNFRLFILTLLGFISLSLMSSSYYIINDLKDYKKDKFHPEKGKRPIASGRISRSVAFFLFLVLFLDSLFLAYLLSTGFLIAVIILFISSQLYIFYFRDIAFFDIILISLNFIIRTLAGVPLVNAPAPTPLVLSAFFLSIFLVSGKRISESYIKDLKKYRPSLEKQHKDTLTLMATASVTSTILFFAIYSLESNPLLLITLPISFYLVLLYFNSVYHDPEKIRNPEKFILDKKILLSLFAWAAILLVSLYFPF
jgi:4-hydroxybenzoate polyprenyltransferase